MKNDLRRDIYTVRQQLIQQIDTFCPFRGTFSDGKSAYDDSETLDRWALNPTPQDNYVGSFSVNLKTGVFHDFATDESRDIFDLFSKVTSLSFQKIIEGFSSSDLLFKPSGRTRDPRGKAPWASSPEDYTSILDGLENPTAAYPYTDAEGIAQFWVFRRDHTGGKYIRSAYYGTDNKLHAGIPDHMSENRPLYRLRELKTRHHAPIMLTEGETCAEAVAKLYPRYQAATWSGGAQAVIKTDFSPLYGRSVFLWPDADEPGIQAIAQKTVRKYIWQKTIPYCKINGHVRFDQVRLEAWIRDRQVPTIDEIRFGQSMDYQNLPNGCSLRRDV